MGVVAWPGAGYVWTRDDWMLNDGRWTRDRAEACLLTSWRADWRSPLVDPFLLCLCTVHVLYILQFLLCDTC